MAVAAVVGGKRRLNAEASVLRTGTCLRHAQRPKLAICRTQENLSWKRVCQPVVCDRPGCELFPRSLGDAMFGV